MHFSVDGGCNLYQVKAIPPARVALALILTLAGYGAMTVYDFLALRYLHQSLAYAKIAMAPAFEIHERPVLSRR